MAKREIKRTDVDGAANDTPGNSETDEAEKQDGQQTPPETNKPDTPSEPKAPETDKPDEKPDEKKNKDLPPEKKAHPEEKIKPLNETVVVAKVPTVIVVRVLHKLILFNDGRKMRREKIVPGKPVTIKITQ
jgi:outer membrane biosynthesis protein TonB